MLWVMPGQAAVEGAVQAGDSGPKSRWGAPRGACPTSGSTVPGALPTGHTFPCLHCSAAFFLVRWSTVTLSSPLHVSAPPAVVAPSDSHPCSPVSPQGRGLGGSPQGVKQQA